MTQLLIPEPPLQVLPTLAERIGLNEAIFLQQLHYWTLRSETGWVYNTYAEWRKQFPWCSEATVKRTLKNLRERSLVHTKQPGGHDRTVHYRPNYDADDLTFSSGHIDPLLERDSETTPEIPHSPQPGNGGDQGKRIEAVREWDSWLEHYHSTTGRTAVRGSAASKRAFAARRKDGYSLDDLCLATLGCHSDDFLRKGGHDVPGTILRPSKVDRYIELGRDADKPTPEDAHEAAVDAAFGIS